MMRDDFDNPLVVPKPPMEENDSVRQSLDWRVYLLAAVCLFLLLVAAYFMIKADKMAFNIQSKTTCDCSFEQKELVGKSPYIQAAHTIFNHKIIDNPRVCGFDDVGFLFGSSMQPTYWEGNYALEINYTRNYVLRPGMLIRYNTASTEDCPLTTPPAAGQYVIHRIEAIYDNDTIITAGDNNPFNEEIKFCQVTHVIVGILFT